MLDADPVPPPALPHAASHGDAFAWLQLLASPGLSRGVARRLLTTFGPPPEVLRAAPAALAQVAGPDVARAILGRNARRDALLAATARWLSESPADAPRHLLALGDPHYPPAWLAAADPPLLLHLVGDPRRLRRPSVAIVGSRHATPQGVANARAFARDLAAHGLTVVSGLALGIDAAAHEGALEAADRRAGTIAVVGTGLDQAYPARNAALAARIGREGLLVSEYPLNAGPLEFHFPQRNRLIAALALGTLVVEAAPQSGSLITARLANEAGREVFAIPGSIHSPQSRGCHRLLRQGAKLVETVEDVMEELRVFLAGDEPPGDDAPHPAVDDAAAPGPGARPVGGSCDPVLAALGHDPVDLDGLAARTGWSLADLGPRLLALELAGEVDRLPGGRLQRRGGP